MLYPPILTHYTRVSRLWIVISRIQTSFSRPSDNSKCNCLKTVEKSSQHLWNSLIMLEIGWKSFGNHWPCFEVVENLSTPSVTFASCGEIFGNFQKSLKIFGNLRKPLLNLRKFKFSVEMKNLMHFTKKKVCRYILTQ